MTNKEELLLDEAERLLATESKAPTLDGQGNIIMETDDFKRARLERALDSDGNWIQNLLETILAPQKQ